MWNNLLVFLPNSNRLQLVGDDVRSFTIFNQIRAFYQLPWICSVCRKSNPILSLFPTFHLNFSKSNMMGATSGAETTFPFESSKFTLRFCGVRVAQSLVFCVVFCRLLFVLFLLVITLSVHLLFTTTGYPIGIFKLLWRRSHKPLTKRVHWVKKQYHVVVIHT